MPKIKALSPIRHNGTPFVEGDEFDVTKEQSDYLIKLGAAELAGNKSVKKPTAAEAAAEKAAAEKAAAEQIAADEKAAADKTEAERVAAADKAAAEAAGTPAITPLI